VITLPAFTSVSESVTAAEEFPISLYHWWGVSIGW
jgi:hypothetical protein